MITNSKIKSSIFVLLVLTFISFIPASVEDQYQVKMSVISPTPVKYESFGGGVAINSDLIIVGAPKGSSGGQVNAGIVYVYFHLKMVRLKQSHLSCPEKLKVSSI